ncbi:MAG: hypothetical protein J0M30_02455 [Chitinophagales bacterium]|nr:hypothetical protein [Chitinophagales bacterium]
MTKTKAISLFVFGILSLSVAYSQPEAVSASLSKVIVDYSNQFPKYLGEPLTSNPQSEEFGSKICIAGAEQCTITKYSAKSKTVYSWQARMPVSEDFSSAVKTYKELFQQAQQTVVTLGDKTFHLVGTYKEPTESLRFHSIILTPDSKDRALKNLKLEILLEADMLEWGIRVILYDKERLDDERGPVIEN